MTLQQIIEAHVLDLMIKAINGDQDAVASLGCIAALTDDGKGPPPDGGGCEIVDLAAERLKRWAA